MIYKGYNVELPLPAPQFSLYQVDCLTMQLTKPARHSSARVMTWGQTLRQQQTNAGVPRGHAGGYDNGHPPPPYGSYGAGPSASARYTADHPVMRHLTDMMEGIGVHNRRTSEMQENLVRIDQRTSAIQQQIDANEQYIQETWKMVSSAQDEAHEYYRYQGFFDPEA